MSLPFFALGDRFLHPGLESHPDRRAIFAELGSWRLLAGSTAGSGHVRRGNPRDDALAVRSGGPWVVVAVADGVGSHSHSCFGASFAVDYLTKNLLQRVSKLQFTATDSWSAIVPMGDSLSGDARFSCRSLEDLRQVGSDPRAGELVWPGSLNGPDLNLVSASEEDLYTALRDAFLATRTDLVERYAPANGLDSRRMGCTLLALLLHEPTGRVVVGQVGDGLIAEWSPGRPSRDLLAAHPALHPGTTSSLTQLDWQDYFVVGSATPPELGPWSLFVMSDGVAEDVTPPPEGILERSLRDLDREMRLDLPLPIQAARLLDWLTSYQKADSFDDRTLVVLLRSSSLAPGVIDDANQSAS